MALSIAIRGGGLTGLLWAFFLSRKGHRVHLFRPPQNFVDPFASHKQGVSWVAAGMVAPLGECEVLSPDYIEAGYASIELWKSIEKILKAENFVRSSNSLYLYHDSDSHLFEHFLAHAKLKLAEDKYSWLSSQEIQKQYPGLSPAFRGECLMARGEAAINGLGFKNAIEKNLPEWGVECVQSPCLEDTLFADFDAIIDCRGLHSRESLPALRGVRGEIITVKSDALVLGQCIRIFHPRHPIYLSPGNEAGTMRIGATSFESEDRREVTVRSALELLSLCYSAFPALGEAEITAMQWGLRPCLDDNLPEIKEIIAQTGRVIHCNGFYRHGYLLGPALISRYVEKEF